MRAESPFRKSGSHISGAHTARSANPPRSRYQELYIQRTSGNMRTKMRPPKPQTARLPNRPRNQPAVNRATTPRYVFKSIPGYSGHLPGKQFLPGGTTHGQEREVLDYNGIIYQPMFPTDTPPAIPYDDRYVKDTKLPGYAGHVPQQRYSCGNFRVEGFEKQYKGEVQRAPFHQHQGLYNPSPMRAYAQ